MTTPTTATGKRPGKAAAQLAAAPQTQPDEAQPAGAPKAEVKPAATLDLGAKPITYYYPAIVLADGTRIECSHRKYGHEAEAAAAKCGRALATQHGVKLA